MLRHSINALNVDRKGETKLNHIIEKQKKHAIKTVFLGWIYFIKTKKRFGKLSWV